MNKPTLKKLARAHADNELDKASYRKSRSELIQGILGGSIPLAEIDYPPLVKPPEPESLDDTQRREDIKKPAPSTPASDAQPQTKKPASAPSGTETSSSSSTGLYIGLAVALLALIAIAAIMFIGEDKSATPSSATTSAGSVANVAEKTGMTAESSSQSQLMIRDFLKTNNWSTSSLNNFAQSWSELPEGDVLSSSASLEMGQLTNAIYKQLLEEQALSGLVDDDSSVQKQEQLVEFAVELGIEDPRISLQP